MSKNSSVNIGGGSDNTWVKLVASTVAVVAVIAIVAVAGMYLQSATIIKISIESYKEATDYLQNNNWWESFKPDVIPLVGVDQPMTDGQTRYFVGVFSETTENGLAYKYLVDKDGNVFYLDKENQIKPLDKENQSVLIGIDMDNTKVWNVVNAESMINDGNHALDESDRVIEYSDTIVSNGKLYYRVNISYSEKEGRPARTDKFHVTEDGKVYIEDENGELKDAPVYEKNTGESSSSSGDSSSSSSAESSTSQSSSTGESSSESSAVSSSSESASTSSSSSESSSSSASSSK